MKRILRRLDATHQQLIDIVTPLDSTVFSRRPSENEWSVAEILHHLGLVEQLVVRQLEDEVKKDPQRVGMLRRLIPTSIVASRLLKVKSPRAVSPTEILEKDVAVDRLNLARSLLKKLCNDHGAGRLRNVVFKHPILGKIDGVATVSFVGYHERRHYKQVREVLKKVSTPP